jgi:hypothetical protein
MRWLAATHPGVPAPESNRQSRCVGGSFELLIQCGARIAWVKIEERRKGARAREGSAREICRFLARLSNRSIFFNDYGRYVMRV